MSISAIKFQRRCYAGAAAFCLLFGIVYEVFSHHVYSVFMIGAFAVPLLGGGIAELLLRKGKPLLSRQLWGGGVIWLTLGCIYKGVLDIYGTTNRLLIVFPVVGILQLIIALLIPKKPGECP